MRQRIRFEDLHHEVTPDGRCRMAVRLEWQGRRLEGETAGLETHQGRLRASADATLAAAMAATGGNVELDLVGVKAVRAFDGWAVVARIDGQAPDRPYRLLGCAACEREEDLLQTTVQAVLDATNRLLERYGAP